MRKIRIPLILLCIMAVTLSFSLFCYASSYTKYSELKTGQAIENVNVRADASSKAELYGKIQKDTKVTLKGYKTKSGTKWYRITYGGRAAYVSSTYVSVVSSTYVSVVSTKPYTIYTPYQTGKTKDSVNVRDGASTKNAVIGRLDGGVQFTIRGHKKNGNAVWYVMTYDGKTGYINSSNVEKTDKYSYTMYTPKKTGTVITDGANVRSKGSMDGTVQAVVPKSMPVTLTGYVTDSEGGTWYRIIYDGKAAYVSSTCIGIEDTYTWTAYTPYRMGEVLKGGAIARKNASTGSDKIVKLAEGQKLTLKGYKKNEKGETWYRISYDGKASYVKATAVENQGSSSFISYTPSVSFKAGEKGAIVRKSASSTGTKIGNLNEGSCFVSKGYVLDYSGNRWNKVSYDGKTGYVCETFTSDADIKWTPYVPARSCEVTDKGAAVKNGVKKSSKTITSCSKGTIFTVKGYLRDSAGVKWYRVRYGSKDGYICSKYAKLKDGYTATIYTPYRAGEVNDDAAKVRKSAATSADALGTVNPETQFTLKGYVSTESGVWYRVTYDGKTGYVRASDLKKTDAPSYVIYTPFKTGKAGKSGAAIRKSPSSKADKYGSLKSGDSLTVRGYRTDSDGVKWYRVIYGGKASYVSSKSVSITGSAEYIMYTPSKYLKAGKKGAAAYEKAAASSKSEGTMNSGTICKTKGYVRDSKGEIWYLISYDGKTGYVDENNVSLTDKPSYVPYTPYKTGEVKADNGAAVYGKASAKSDKRGTAYKGAVFTIRGYDTVSGVKYYSVIYNGKSSYVKASDIKIIDRLSYTVYTKFKSGTVTADAAVRKSASASADKVTTVKQGTVFAIKGYSSRSSGCWYRVTYDGKAGYIDSDMIDITGIAEYTPYTPEKKYTAEETVNIRSKVSTESAKVGKIPEYKSCTVKGYRYDNSGNKWYRVSYDGDTGYVLSKYLTSGSVSSFEKQLSKEGFPDSYKPYLRTLHKAHPKWVFKAQKPSVSWDEVVYAETSNIRRNLYNGPYASWKSMEKGAYDFSRGSYVSFDGAGWVAAYSGLTKYYLDPRNFLNNDYIFMFMDQSFDSSTQSISSVKKIASGTFLANKFPESSYDSYAECIYYAGKAANMNPNVLASMIIQEQGSSGNSKLISGNVSGYRGYYNFLNIGAYTTGSMSAVQRGLWYAKGAGTGATSYGRPWNSRAKAIKGGAKFYAEGYINSGQNTLYLKKFNVMNGISNLGLHQYMTNVQGAAGEASLMRNAYSSINDAAITFKIPVYKGMPSSAVKLPSKEGNNNNLLSSLKVSGYGFDSSFTKYDQTYSIRVSSSVSSIKVSASPSNSSAKVTGTGTIKLASGTNTVKVKCKSTSGVTRTYTITVNRK